MGIFNLLKIERVRVHLANYWLSSIKYGNCQSVKKLLIAKFH